MGSSVSLDAIKAYLNLEGFYVSAETLVYTGWQLVDHTQKVPTISA